MTQQFILVQSFFTYIQLYTTTLVSYFHYESQSIINTNAHTKKFKNFLSSSNPSSGNHKSLLNSSRRTWEILSQKTQTSPWSFESISSWLNTSHEVVFNHQHQRPQCCWSSSSIFENPSNNFLSMSHKFRNHFGSIWAQYKINDNTSIIG